MKNTETQTLKRSFRQDGYIVLPGFLNRDEIEDLNNKLEEFIKTKVSEIPSQHLFYEKEDDTSTLKQMQHLFVYDPYFKEMLLGSKFREVAKTLLDDEVIGKELEYFNKPPKIGKPTPPHQDNYYFMLEPPKAITMWLALEEVDEENGCIRYLKGSHRKGMRPHGRSEILGFSQGITDYDEEDFSNEIAMPVQPGDLLVHHSMTIHRADKNNSSSRSRRAMGLIYFAESAEEDVEAKENYRKKLMEEKGED